MGAIFKKYGLKLVKEESGRYDFSRKVSSPKDIYEISKGVYELDSQTEEVLLLLTLDTKNNITGGFEVHRGSINSSIVHPREIFKRAILNNSDSIVIVHNHPSSGCTEPSKEDISVTEKIKKAGELLGISLLDHIIVGDGYFSFKEKSLML